MGNIKEKIDEIVEKVKKDPDFAKKFKSSPVKAIEEVAGVDLPEDKINDVVKAVETKINLSDNKIVNKIKDLF